MADTRTQLLDNAQALVQSRGYNGFSYRDLAEIVGVKTSTIHYYFPTKADLAIALLKRYRDLMQELLSGVEKGSHTPEQKLLLLCDRMAQTLCDNGKLCLCGVFAAESSTLPENVVEELQIAIESLEQWITGILREGQSAGQFTFTDSTEKIAKVFFAALQGNLMCARVCSDPETFSEHCRLLVGLLK